MDSQSRPKRGSLRKRAEKILSQNPEEVREIPVEDIKRLIHELDVSQIELDMQNDELRRAQAEIELSRTKYVDLYDFAPVGYFTLTATGRVEDVNLPGARLLGVERTHLVNRNIRRFIAPDFTSLFESHCLEVLASDSVRKCELKLVRKDGSPLYVSLESLSIKSKDGSASLIRSAMSDITDRYKAQTALRESEKELRSLSSQLLDAQEKERRQVAGDLHDNIWQTLNAIKFDIDDVLSRQAAGPPPGSGKSIERLNSNIRNAVETIRTMQGGLWPPVLDDIGILATINWFSREFEKNYGGVTIEKQIGVTEEEVPARLKIVIYRVMQEALKNVALHSGASRVLLSLRKDEEKIEFTINDNGGGFDIERILFRTRPWAGFGLVAMRERIEHSGGTLDVDSGGATGTTVCASWPLADSGEDNTGRKPIKKVLEGPEEQFRMVTESISDWVYAFRVEPNGKFVWDWVTPGFTAVTGYRTDEIRVNADLSRIIHPEDRPVLEERFHCIRALQPHVSEYRILTQTGEICWVRDSIIPAADPLHPGTIKVIGAAQNITERKRIERALRENEERFRVAIAGSPVTVYQHDKDLRITWVYNPPHGFLAEQLLGKKMEEVHPSEEAAYLTKVKRSVLESGVRTRGETWITVNGDRRYVDFSVEPLRDEAGQIIGVTCATVDITERKRAEEALQRSEQLFSSIFRASPAATILSWWADGRCVDANEAYAKLVGYTREELVGKSTVELNIWMSAEERQRVVTELAQRGHLENIELTLRKKNGELIHTVAAGETFTLDGQRYILSFFFDITERKQTEQALQAREEQYRAFFYTTAVGTAEITLDGKFSDVNERLCEITGYSREELLRMTPAELTHPDDRVREKERLMAYLSGRSPDYQAEKRYIRKDGQTVWIQVSAAMIRDASGKSLHSAGIIRDITARKRAEETLRKSKDELELGVRERTAELEEAFQRLGAENTQRKRLEETLRASETRVRFFASQCLTAQETERKRVAGELHDSIAAALGAMQFRIEREAGEMKQGHGSPEALHDLASKVREIIDDVRRIMVDLRPSILDDIGIIPAMNWFCREYQKTYSHIAVENQIGISEDQVPDPLKTPIFRISQEAMNNIAKHSKASLVTLDLRERNGTIELTIQDNGQGFDLETAGRGMGLSTMRERAELSGGSFTFESAERQGTTVRVSWILSENN